MSQKRLVLDRLGTLLGLAGLAIWAACIAGRFYGAPTFLGHNAINASTVGIGLMAAACWLKLESRGKE